MDSDIEAMSREQLIDEVLKLRAGIREHRDCSGHDLCWHHPQLCPCFLKKPATAFRFRSGLNLCAAAFNTANPWTNSFHRRRE